MINKTFVKLIEENYFKFVKFSKQQKLTFLKELEMILANYFEVPNCDIFIKSLSPKTTSFGNIPPACFRCSPNDLSVNPQIFFDEQKLNEYSFTKIIKLLFHEWMHYLSHHHLHISPCKNIPEKYLAFINMADNVKKLHIENLENERLGRALQKLSPNEYVADLFARDILKFLAESSSPHDLKLQAQEKIEREENMQEKHLRSINKICGTNYSTSREIEFEKILKTRRKKECLNNIN